VRIVTVPWRFARMPAANQSEKVPSEKVPSYVAPVVLGPRDCFSESQEEYAERIFKPLLTEWDAFVAGRRRDQGLKRLKTT